MFHLLPADQQYDLPTFTSVLVYNGHNHFTPTFLSNQADLQEWRVSLLSRHVQASIDMFDQIEANLVDETLPPAFDNLRDAIIEVDSLIGEEKLSKNKTLPNLVLGSSKAQKKFPHVRKVNLKEAPIPNVVLVLPPFIADPPTEKEQEPKENVPTATKSTRGSAPLRVTTSLYGSSPPGRRFFPGKLTLQFIIKPNRYKNVLFAHGANSTYLYRWGFDMSFNCSNITRS